VEESNPDDFDLVANIHRIYDEPFADSSALPTYRVCELARRRVKVALSGDGGDENLAGYNRYQRHLREEKLRSLFPLSLRKSVFGPLGRIYPDGTWLPKVLRAKATLNTFARNSVESYFQCVAVVGDNFRHPMYSQEFLAELQGYSAVEVLQNHAQSAPTDHVMSLVQYLDIKTYLAGDILTKVDRASMAHALEVRVPILDHKLVEWMSRLPPELKLNHNQGKYLFKKSLEDRLPKDILYRKKMGFAVPLAKWFRGPLREKVQVVSESLAESKYFNTKIINEIVMQHQSGKRDHSSILWSLFVFDSFQKQISE
jgi:asparagine synthase (glutamine-hydrolysing)